jgi:hypothetical protein
MVNRWVVLTTCLRQAKGCRIAVALQAEAQAEVASPEPVAGRTFLAGCCSGRLEAFPGGFHLQRWSLRLVVIGSFITAFITVRLSLLAIDALRSLS